MIDCNSCKRLFPSFCSLPSEVAVLFDWNQGPMNRKIVQSNESCFSLSLVLAKSIEVPFYIKSVKMAQNLLSI